MVSGWPFLAISGGIFLGTIGVVRGVLALLDRRAKQRDSMTEQWLADQRRTQKPPDRAA